MEIVVIVAHIWFVGKYMNKGKEAKDKNMQLWFHIERKWVYG